MTSDRDPALRVLLVEDNPADAELVSALLETDAPGEFAIARASRLRAACDHLRGHAVDCVLYDLGLPDASGLDALTDLREASSSCAIVVLTGNAEVDGVAALRAGAHDYLVKGRADGDTIARALRYSVERRRTEERLQYIADHDALTGLLNRRRLAEDVARHANHVRRYGADGALLVLDLDHFKCVNDAFGHHAGDDLLATVAGLLRTRARTSDVLARLGGDEFAVLMVRGGAEDALVLANDLRDIIRDQAAIGDGEARRRTTACIGIALFDDDGQSAGEDALVRADLAMYDAKQGGRDGVALAGGERRGGPEPSWGARIRLALSEDTFELYGQPIRPIHGEAQTYELLLRLCDRPGEVVGPGEFLPIAERLDLVQQIDRWVVERAIRLLADRDAEASPVTVHVNLSGRSVGDPLLLDLVQRSVLERAIDASRLVFEFTETAAVADLERARAFALRLTELGCPVALDDFGAGFGSFAYLKHLSCEYLKIDGEFVRGCLDDPTDQVVIDAVVRIARAMGKRTIAEFVEEAETARFLEERGVDFLQGYWIGRPEPIAGLLAAA